MDIVEDKRRYVALRKSYEEAQDIYERERKGNKSILAKWPVFPSLAWLPRRAGSSPRGACNAIASWSFRPAGTLLDDNSDLLRQIYLCH